MLPVKKQTHEFRTLEEIRQRKDELADKIQEDNGKFTTLWNQVFIKKEGISYPRLPVSSVISKKQNSSSRKNTKARACAR